MQKTNINPEILQAMLDSATNAAEKGQSQFFTPLEFGRELVAALPKARAAILDLNCGAGHLLQASITAQTRWLFGSDIDPCRKGRVSIGSNAPVVNRINQDLTLLYPLLKEAGFAADLLVLNPPWRLFWHRNRLEDLASSELSAVRDAFHGHEDTAPKGTIDSTIATLLIALDLCTIYGEGFLVANNNTLERLLFASGAPHAAVAKHIWAHVVIRGNPMTGIEGCNWNEDEQFHTGVIYFARDHTAGPQRLEGDLCDISPQLAGIRSYRLGAEVRSVHDATSTSVDTWNAVKDQVATIAGKAAANPWNLWMTSTGRIRTGLSMFQKVSRKVNKTEAARLHALNDKTPMELVLQRSQRDELLHVAEKGGWKVQPELIAAIHGAIRDYHASRAPLYPLPKIQRLGYLDEHDQIVCEHDLSSIFRKGGEYRLRTQTVAVTRKQSKPNAFTGDIEELEFTGQELAIFLALGDVEYCFMDAALKNDPDTQVVNAKQCKGKPHNPKEPAIDFTLQELADHFLIPEVPDVATVNPAGYAANVKLLEELEALCPM